MPSSDKPELLRQRHRPRTDLVLPIVLFLSLAAAGGFLWWRVQQAHRDRLSSEARVVTGLVRERLESFIQERMRSARFLAASWPERYRDDPDSFRRDAAVLADQLPALQALNWVDDEGVIRIVVPEEPNRAALGAYLFRHPEPGVREAIAAAAASLEPRRTEAVIELLQGGRGFASYFPVTDGSGRLLGFVNAVYRLDEVMEACLPGGSLEGRFRFAVQEVSGPFVFARNGFRDGPVDPSTEPSHWPAVAVVSVDVLGRPWRLYVAPTEEQAAALAAWDRGPLLTAILASAAAIAWLLGTALRGRSEVRARERQVRALLDSTVEGIFGVDLDGRGTFVNRAALEMLGLEGPADFLGRDVHGLIHHTRRDGSPNPLEECAIRLASRHRKPVLANEILWREGGASFEAEVHAHPVVEDGVLTGAVVTFEDVTERRALESRLLHAHKMESVGLLAGGMAHDFNNHLSVMMGNAEMAAKLLPTDHGAQAHLEAVVTSARFAADLIRQLLTYAGRESLDLGPVELVEVVEEMSSLLATSLRKNIALSLHSEGEAPWVRADRSRLGQVVLNLVTNAAEAIGEESGSIEVSTGTETVPGLDLTNCVAGRPKPGTFGFLRVRDDGPGMSAETVARAFDPFFTTKAEGRGLGLSTLAGIVETHGGGILLETELGRGTTITVLIPATEEPTVGVSSSESQPEPALETRTPGVILVVDDEVPVRQLATTVARNAGFDVLEAGDGIEALERLSEAASEIRLVLLDLKMPRMDGETAYERIREREPELPVLFSTGYETATVADRVDSDPNLHLLRKPYRVDELAARLAELVHAAEPDADDAAGDRSGT